MKMYLYVSSKLDLGLFRQNCDIFFFVKFCQSQSLTITNISQAFKFTCVESSGELIERQASVVRRSSSPTLSNCNISTKCRLITIKLHTWLTLGGEKTTCFMSGCHCNRVPNTCALSSAFILTDFRETHVFCRNHSWTNSKTGKA